MMNAFKYFNPISSILSLIFIHAFFISNVVVIFPEFALVVSISYSQNIASGKRIFEYTSFTAAISSKIFSLANVPNGIFNNPSKY